MRKIVAFMLLAAFALVACGSDSTGSGSGDNGGASGDIKAWCDLSSDYEERFSALENGEGFDPTDPEQMETFFTEAREALENAEDVAPAEIRADVKVLADGFGTFVDAMVEADWDFTKVNPEVAEELNSERFQTASDNIEKFNEKECGIKAEGGAGE